MILFAVAACAADDPAPELASRQDCEALRDHVLALRLDGVTADVDEHAAALAAALGDEWVTDCESQVTATALECQLAATSGDALTACQEVSR